MSSSAQPSPEPPESVPEEFGTLPPTDREKVEDVLRALLECEHRDELASEERVAGLAGMSRETMLHALVRASEAGLASHAGRSWRLTGDGREIAVLVMRAHRLIETRLARESSVPPKSWHDVAHAREHGLSREEVNRLADALDNPRFDPHGDPIPTREGGFPEPEGEPLLSWHATEPGVITHIEDEPPSLFARLAAMGVFAGMRFVLRRTTRRGCEIELEGKRILLPLELATMVHVRLPQAAEQPAPPGSRRLSELAPGAAASVVALLPGCIGAERSRLLDLGFVPGSRVEPVMQSPFDGPVAYRVRGTLIALRREQAQQVLVLPADS
jgi:DtxR family Mn-dependent transcriptional regulator